MIKQCILAATLCSVSPSDAQAVEPGRYSLGFRMANDVGGTQEIELINFHSKPGGYGSFDVKVSAKGLLERSFAENGQTVHGMYNDDGKFIFIIPFASMDGVTGFKFVGNDLPVGGRYKGTVYVLAESEYQPTEGPFTFWMERVVAR